MSGGRLVQVFRSSRREGHYLFVDLAEGLARVPEALLLHFGHPQPVLKLKLSPERRLAAADAAGVLSAIAEKGFYLQLPPPPGTVNAGKEGGGDQESRSGEVES